MVENFVGTWKMISSENFDDYMKAIGRRDFLASYLLSIQVEFTFKRIRTLSIFFSFQNKYL